MKKKVESNKHLMIEKKIVKEKNLTMTKLYIKKRLIINGLTFDQLLFDRYKLHDFIAGSFVRSDMPTIMKLHRRVEAVITDVYFSPKHFYFLGFFAPNASIY